MGALGGEGIEVGWVILLELARVDGNGPDGGPNSGSNPNLHRYVICR